MKSAVVLLLIAFGVAQGHAGAVKVTLAPDGGLIRDGRPYFIKGAGAHDHGQLACGEGDCPLGQRCSATGACEPEPARGIHAWRIAPGFHARPCEPRTVVLAGDPRADDFRALVAVAAPRVVG